MSTAPSRIAVVIASKGRPTELGEMVDHLQRQTVAPAATVFSVTGPEDLPDLDGAGLDIEVVVGPPGLPAQRNTGMERCLDRVDVIAFFDDDYVPSRYALADIQAFFRQAPGAAGLQGRLLADGITGPGVSLVEALRLVSAHDAAARPDAPLRHAPIESLYGCNMIFRADAIGDLRFDEALPLYGWQEDVDFSVRVGARGGLWRAEGPVGVHRGVKGGRSPGVQFGYSQIANPLYLVRKGTMRRRRALIMMARNFAANHGKVLTPEPWVDRAGRVRGNWLALADLVRGRLHPTRILDL